MGFLDSPQKKDSKVAAKFQKRFNRMIVGRDKESGRLVVLFRSKSDVMIQVKTAQKEPEELEREPGKTEN